MENKMISFRTGEATEAHLDEIMAYLRETTGQPVKRSFAIRYAFHSTVIRIREEQRKVEGNQ